MLMVSMQLNRYCRKLKLYDMSLLKLMGVVCMEYEQVGNRVVLNKTKVHTGLGRDSNTLILAKICTQTNKPNSPIIGYGFVSSRTVCVGLERASCNTVYRDTDYRKYKAQPIVCLRDYKPLTLFFMTRLEAGWLLSQSYNDTPPFQGYSDFNGYCRLPNGGVATAVYSSYIDKFIDTFLGFESFVPPLPVIRGFPRNYDTLLPVFVPAPDGHSIVCNKEYAGLEPVFSVYAPKGFDRTGEKAEFMPVSYPRARNGDFRFNRGVQLPKNLAGGITCGVNSAYGDIIGEG